MKKPWEGQLWVQTPSGRQLVWFKIYDTPGFADTAGQTKDIMDAIIEHAKIMSPHVFIVVDSGRANPAVNFGLKAFGECVKGGLSKQNFVLITNQNPTEKTWRRQHGDNWKETMDLDQATRKRNAELSLGISMGYQFVLDYADDPEQSTAISTTVEKVLNYTCWVNQRVDPSELKTFSEILTYAQRMVNDAVNAHEAAQNSLDMERKQLQKAQKDKAWHEDHVKDMTAAIIASGAAAGAGGILAWFTFGLGAVLTGGAGVSVVACVAARQHSVGELKLIEANIAKLEASISDIEHDAEGHLRRQKDFYTAYLAEMQDLQTQMEQAATAPRA